MVNKANSQVARIAGVDNRLDWVDGVAKVDDELD